MAASIEVERVEVAEILPLRELYRQEMNCQIVHDSLHRRGFNDSYLIRVDGNLAGYGTVTSGRDEHRVFPRGTVNEFYLLPAYQPLAGPVFRSFLAACEAVRIEAQTNDVLLMPMVFDFATRIMSDRILFEDERTTNLFLPDVVFREATPSDRERMVRGQLDPESRWLLEAVGEVVAAGGFLTHYNPPYGDVYMAVAEPHRRRGYGSLLVQELKRVCYEAGRKPAARCNATNIASRRTLERAGFRSCARMISGDVRAEETATS